MSSLPEDPAQRAEQYKLAGAVGYRRVPDIISEMDAQQSRFLSGIYHKDSYNPVNCIMLEPGEDPPRFTSTDAKRRPLERAIINKLQYELIGWGLPGPVTLTNDGGQYQLCFKTRKYTELLLTKKYLRDRLGIQVGAMDPINVMVELEEIAKRLNCSI